jgi:glycosyltransferase involved in cell wall biosynthesis
MSVYNAERYLAEAVESILATGFGGLRILVIDDGSTDESLGISLDRFRINGWSSLSKKIRACPKRSTEA